MTFKSTTPKKEECILPMQIIRFKNNKPNITHCHGYEKYSDQTKEMICRIVEVQGKEKEK